jgi:hypothetical protein
MAIFQSKIIPWTYKTIFTLILYQMSNLRFYLTIADSKIIYIFFLLSINLKKERIH